MLNIAGNNIIMLGISRLKLSFYFKILSLLHIATLVECWQMFYGDSSVDEFLRTFCFAQGKSATIKTALLISGPLDEMQMLNNTKSDSEKWLQMISLGAKNHSCSLSAHISHVESKSQFQHQLRVDPLLKIRSSRIQLLFDLRIHKFKSWITKTKFKLIIRILAQIYTNCEACLPIIALMSEFGENMRISETWTRKAIHSVNENFRLAIVLTQNTQQIGNIIHVRPIVDGCRFDFDIFVPRNKLDFERLKTHSSACDLHHTTLNVSVNSYVPFCDISRGDRGQLLARYGLETELLHLLEQKYRFHSILIDGRQDWGAIINQKWTGIVSQLINGTANLAICSISQIVERSQVVDYSEYVFQDDFTFASHMPNRLNRGLILMSPFDAAIWLCTIIAIIALSLTIFVIYRIGGISSPHDHRQNHQPARRQSPPSLVSINLQLIAIYFCNDSRKTKNRVTSDRICLLYALWMLASLVLANWYCGLFFAFIAIPDYGRPLDTIEDLYDVSMHDYRTVYVQKYSAQWMSIMNAPPDNWLYYQLAKHINRTKREFIVGEDMRLIDMMEENYYSIGLIMRTAIGIYIARSSSASNRAQFHIASETISHDHLSLMVPKRSPILEPINTMIMRSREMGLIDQWLRTAINAVPVKPNTIGVKNRFEMQTYASGGGADRVDERQQTFAWSGLPLQSITTIFYLLAIGYTIAIIALIGEIFADYYYYCVLIGVRANEHTK